MFVYYSKSRFYDLMLYYNNQSLSWKAFELSERRASLLKIPAVKLVDSTSTTSLIILFSYSIPDRFRGLFNS